MTHITPGCVCYRCVMIYRKFNTRTTHSAGARPPCGKVGSRDRYVHVSDLADATSLGARRAAMQASDAWFGSAGSISFIPPTRLPWHFVGRKHSGDSESAASWPKPHHRAEWQHPHDRLTTG